MAGMPIYRALKERVREAGGEGVLFERIASGENLTAIGKTYGVSRFLIAKLLKRTPQLKAKYHEAQRQAAGAHADKAGEVLDLPDDAPMPQVAAARNRSEYHRWMAMVADRATYGKGEGDAALSIGELHLHALQATGRPVQQVLRGQIVVPAPSENGDDGE
jgi:Bacteriophage Sf6, terminase small subunit-like